MRLDAKRNAPEFVATTVARDVAECRGKKANSPSSRQKLTSQLSRGESLRTGVTASVRVNRRSVASPLAKVTVAVGSGPRLLVTVPQTSRPNGHRPASQVSVFEQDECLRLHSV